MKKILPVIVALFLIHSLVWAQEFEGQSAPVRVSMIRDTEPPQVFWVYRNEGRPNSAGRIGIDIRVLDQAGIKSVTINGRERMDGGVKDSVGFAVEFYNEDEVYVNVVDNFGNAKEKSFIVKAQAATLAGSKIARKNYALLLAVNDYADSSFPTLTGPIQDATALKNVLIKKYGFEDANITLIKNPKSDDLDVAFEALRYKVTSDDMLLIFYAGHGWFDQDAKIGYWLPSDASKANKSRWFRNSTLVENIGAINSKHTLLIADACFSGGIFATRAVTINNATAEISNLMKKTSRKAMTSGKLTPVPDNSVFMKYLLKTLEENEYEFLPSEDLFDSVRMSMKNNSETKPAYGEIRNTGDEGGNFVFVQKK